MRRSPLAVGALVATVAAGAGALVAHRAGRDASAAAPATGLAVARVVRTDVTETLELSGSLSYGPARTIVSQMAGTAFTALPAPGAVVRRGRVLFRVDDRPAALLDGATPAWRTLALGVSDGGDVRQLERNLVALGDAHGLELTVDDHFSAVTAIAVERWQAALGEPQTGVVTLGDVVYAPTPARVATVSAVLGAPVEPGAPVAAVTSTRVGVTAPIDVANRYLVHAGDAVSVKLPGQAAAVPGVVSAVARVASASTDDAGGGPGTGQGASGTTVAVTVALRRGAVAAAFDQSPATVDVVSARHRGVLAVPVSALLALAGGGYAVQLAGRPPRLVAVRTGLFTDTLVEITGRGLAPGVAVAVPAG